MRIYIETTKLTKNDLRLLASKTGKSIKVLKRLKQTHSYLMHCSANHHYDFLGYSHYAALRTEKTREQFFKNIEQLELLRLL